jgi:hypothetical protein
MSTEIQRVLKLKDARTVCPMAYLKSSLTTYRHCSQLSNTYTRLLTSVLTLTSHVENLQHFMQICNQLTTTYDD